MLKVKNRSMLELENTSVFWSLWLIIDKCKFEQETHAQLSFLYITLEIKPCGHGSRIPDMEAEWRLKVITDLISW